MKSTYDDYKIVTIFDDYDLDGHGLDGDGCLYHWPTSKGPMTKALTKVPVVCLREDIDPGCTGRS